MELLNEGPIIRVNLSDDWERTSDKPDYSAGETLTNFALKTDSEVVVQFYFDGCRSGDSDGKEFLELLSKAPHALSEEEELSAFVITGGAGYPEYFDTRFAGTRIIGGKTVLVVDGVWKTNGMYDFGIFVPRDASGCEVQEVHFVCPAGKYEKSCLLFEQVMHSIRW